MEIPRKEKSRIPRRLKFISRLFSDEGLTKKAYLNALTVVLDYGASMIVGYIITPLMVVGLGNFGYGMWQVLQNLIGYISPASGRPGFALKAVLANQQTSTDYDQKRRYVGSTLIIWLLFLPVLVGIGGTISWFAPNLVHAPASYNWIVRIVAGLFVFNTIIDALSSVPLVSMQGENLGYKRMGMSVVLVFAGGGFTWLALYFKSGLVGVAGAAVASTLATGLFYLYVVRKYLPWFGVAKPRLEDTRRMLGLSWWFMLWNLVTSLLFASDIVVLGLLESVESVTNYSLTQYVPFTLVGIIVIILFGIVPGLGGIIGTGDFERAVRLREEINSSIWLLATTIGASVLVWNRVFLGLWVGADHYAGSTPNLLIIVMAMQLAFFRSDGNIIDLTLRLNKKVLLGLISSAISIGVASLLVGYFKLGIVGLCLGIMGGRLIMTIGYPMLIGHFLGIQLSSRLNSLVRPAVVTIPLFLIAFGVDKFIPVTVGTGIKGWIIFLLSAGVTGIVMLFISFYAGLSSDQRKSIISRIQTVMTTSKSS
jgi:O-antigen/teichoic acid export membrane protein